MRHSFVCGLMMAGVAAYASPAVAEPARGFATNRFEPAARGSEWFVLDTLDAPFAGEFDVTLGGVVSPPPRVPDPPVKTISTQ